MLHLENYAHVIRHDTVNHEQQCGETREVSGNYRMGVVNSYRYRHAQAEFLPTVHVIPFTNKRRGKDAESHGISPDISRVNHLPMSYKVHLHLQFALLQVKKSLGLPPESVTS